MDNLEIKKSILSKIEQYNRIIICRHFRPDGDAVGSTKGLHAILKASYPDKEILLINDDYCDYMQFLGKEDSQLDDAEYRNALVIVCDTASVDRISNKKYGLAQEIVKIDHHIDIAPYGSVSWVEDWRSSCCEMIVDFYLTFKDRLTLTSDAALYLYTGMVTDTGRFKYNSVNKDTMICAATLLEKGIDTDWLFANLYLEDFNELKFESYCYEKMNITKNGVAYLIVDNKMQQDFNLTREQASNCVGYLDSIKGSICWIAFIENPDHTYRVRLRSRFMTINKVAEKYRGGGHECACGATLLDPREIDLLLYDADALTGEYKSTHTNWM